MRNDKQTIYRSRLFGLLLNEISKLDNRTKKIMQKLEKEIGFTALYDYIQELETHRKALRKKGII